MPDNCGGLAHIGEDYDAATENGELRILFVGYDYGHGHADLRHRQTDIQDYSDNLNPHYKGIVKTLIEIYQEGGKESWKHLLRRMVQTNATRCAAPDGNRVMKSNTTHRMRMNCWKHFKKEIEVLEPTIIWFHGAALKSPFLQALREERLSLSVPFAQYAEYCGQIEWTVFEKPFSSFLAFFHHPAYGHFGKQWELAARLVAHLRKQGSLPIFNSEWNGRDRKEWPSI